MLVIVKKYARVEEGYDAYMHQVIPPSTLMSGTPTLIATLVEFTPTLLLASLSALKPEKQPLG